tara:strand:+ start:11126 stop:12133 length:1008 start_codon:yes stop_codon:yes gene_type:complete
MIYGNFIIHPFKNNECFDPNARDNCCAAFIGLRDTLKKNDIEINTKDLNINNKISFEIHIDKQISHISNIPKFLFLWESSNVKPSNKSVDKKKYNQVYSWDDSLVSSEKYTKFYLPVTDNLISDLPKFQERQGFCCAMSSNKTPQKQYKKDLYSERLKLYKWFEQNAPQNFSLFGPGWDRLTFEGIFQNKIFIKMIEKLNIKSKNFKKIYKGYADSKSSVLQKFKFSICYENVYGLNGYITEKIFDSMFAGCVPIYWGAENITSYVPEECFIDRRNFNNTESLYNFLKTVDENAFIDYQTSISNYLKSDKFKKFSNEYFVENIASDILKVVNGNR